MFSPSFASCRKFISLISGKYFFRIISYSLVIEVINIILFSFKLLKTSIRLKSSKSLYLKSLYSLKESQNKDISFILFSINELFINISSGLIKGRLISIFSSLNLC